MSTDKETRNRLLPYVGYAGIAGATFNTDGMSVAEALVAAKLALHRRRWVMGQDFGRPW